MKVDFRPGVVLLSDATHLEVGVVQFHPSSFLEADGFYRFDLSAEQNAWLESVKGPALRTPLAGLIGDRDILRQRKR
jgi:hypothetical protein